MRVTTFNPVRFRGNIEASETNRLYEIVESLSNIAGRQGIRSSIGSAGTFLVNEMLPGFFARISAINVPSSDPLTDPYTYSWVSQLDNGDGTWQDDSNGLTGDYASFPAFELNNTPTPLNTIVYMHVGLGSAGLWAWFAYTPPARIVRIVNPIPNSYGYLDAVLQVYNPNTPGWEDSTSIWLLDANA